MKRILFAAAAVLAALVLPLQAASVIDEWGNAKAPPPPALKPAAVDKTYALLVVDIALNPTIEFLDFKFSSVYQYFFAFVPGFDGLRSEYRIIVLLPIFMSIIAAIALRRFFTVG